MKLITILLLLLNFLFTPITTANAATLSDNTYQQRTHPSSDGIGKYYMGREIAKVMGHTGAGWLERPRREVEEQPSKIVSALNLQPDNVVADIGAGTGYLSFRIAPLLTDGKVLAVDIQPEMLEIIDFFKQEKNITNVEPILATLTNPNLPDASVDLALMVDAYHELEYPQEVMTGIVKALKPGGKVVLVEYRGENPLIMIKRLHKMTQKQVRKEMQAVGLVWRETKNLLPQQHLMIFEKQA
ncbi:class I SAM-dependent methyltransferase [Nodularia spumigena]|jgi:SAM-dependent methyltransferase|uniref:Methyltransferase domain-containing protein n=1 Tax=Nodularia spumigena UHCC 0060 TaxID=3110300 RepID=A0ABU5UUU7_NODSP|nr:methyltransferase domain-containing protein [Nodularia spumigena]MEA5526552.1 methyltransferase domain-containing protein [Nodularia spumigena UHCC 0143]MEA5556382.1 methyltransferase domain-containing protein [Nodularia spumigena CH309]MEA5609633.1 methyltransferase domain-containing protein [Nodularia spumigena UHCC 0060]MEA5612099.1 methyltransferase domain-containing protein [Nodularia spumigena UHCC 0040]